MGVEDMFPENWWRPPLSMVWALDHCACLAPDRVAVLAGEDLSFIAATLMRFPTATVVVQEPAYFSAGVRLRDFVGGDWTTAPLTVLVQDEYELVIGAAATVVQLVRPLAAQGVRAGVLAVYVDSRVASSSVLPLPQTVTIRYWLRRHGYFPFVSEGYLGPRALVSSALGRFALLRGDQALYDEHHSAMRRHFRTCWPVTMFAQAALILARKRMA
ncbi:MAG: hypothetical protein M1118_14085 [Chloroflexi bacterium]|nr:hypothetical protein [Chloroflexota bacterium]